MRQVRLLMVTGVPIIINADRVDSVHQDPNDARQSVISFGKRQFVVEGEFGTIATKVFGDGVPV